MVHCYHMCLWIWYVNLFQWMAHNTNTKTNTPQIVWTSTKSELRPDTLKCHHFLSNEDSIDLFVNYVGLYLFRWFAPPPLDLPLCLSMSELPSSLFGYEWFIFHIWNTRVAILYITYILQLFFVVNIHLKWDLNYQMLNGIIECDDVGVVTSWWFFYFFLFHYEMSVFHIYMW